MTDLEKRALEAFIKRAGFTFGWENLESWARRMAEQAVRELQQAQPEYDRALIASMLENGAVCGNAYSLEAIAEQARLLRAADNADAAGARTFNTSGERVNDPADCVHEPQSGNWIVADDVYRLAREIDVALNGEEGAAGRPSLVDVTAQVKRAARKLGHPLLAEPHGLDAAVEAALHEFDRMHGHADLPTILSACLQVALPHLRGQVPDGYVLIPLDAITTAATELAFQDCEAEAADLLNAIVPAAPAAPVQEKGNDNG